MKKIIIATVVALSLCVMVTSTAFAGNHGGGHSSSHRGGNTTVSESNKKSTRGVCNVKNCTKTSNHSHNGKTYSGHSSGDGHKNHNSSHK